MKPTAAFAVLLAVLAMLPACLTDDDTPVAEDRSEITHGSPAFTQYPATGAILLRNATPFVWYQARCTGTLIAPDVVLAEPECVFGYPASKLYFTLSLNSDVTSSSSRVSGRWSEINVPANLALLYLDWAPAVTPARLASPAIDATLAVGTPVGIVGYTEDGGNDHLKRWGSAQLASLTATTLHGSGPSVGAIGDEQEDDGGPMYLTAPTSSDVVVGIQYQAYWYKGADYARVGPALMWIHQHVALPCNSGLPCDQRCGDDTCDPTYETATTCPGDCPDLPVCGDAVCESGENCGTCPGDCGLCQCPAGFDVCWGDTCCTNNCSQCI